MPRWYVGLNGHEFDLQELSRLFCTEARGVIHQEGKYYLVSSQLDGIDGPGEVLLRGQALLKDMNVAAQLGNSSYQPVEGDDVILDEQGKRHQFVFPSGVELRFRVSSPTVSVGGSEDVKPERQTLEQEFWADLSERDEKVRKAFDLLALNKWDDWGHLYKVFEVVESDAGGRIVGEGWATSKEVTLFSRTATLNRHPVPKAAPPPRPMPLKEAQALIRRIVVCWLRSKTCPR